MRSAIIPILAVVAILVLLWIPPIHQDPAYHRFADQRTLWGVPNFSNVASNLPFLLVALYGLGAIRRRAAFLQTWERVSYAIFVLAIAMVAFGSAYYHADPNQQTLFWDRLPMTVGFMSLLASTIGERVGMRAGRLILPVLLGLGVAAVWYWQQTGDLRPYVFIQFFPLLALPILWLLYPPRYSGSAGLWGLAGFYLLAKLLELADTRLGTLISTGGHPWKHLASAAGIFWYFQWVRRRKPLGPADA